MADYLIALYIGRRGNSFSVFQDTEAKMVTRLFAIAVVVYIAAGGRGYGLRQHLLRLRADGDFVLRRCALRRGFGCLCCRLRLCGCVDWLNGLNRNTHEYHLTLLTSTSGKLTLAPGGKKRGNCKRSEQKRHAPVGRASACLV